MTSHRRAALLGLAVLGLAACSSADAGSAAPSSPAPGPVPPAVAAQAAGVELPATAASPTATLRRAESGVDSHLLVFTLPGPAELQAFCTDSGMNGPAPRPGALTARAAESLGVARSGPGRLVCGGSLPGDYDVQRDVLALPSPDGLEVRLLTFRMPR